MTISFPPDFVWGAATAAYQIEGAYNEDGKGESIWDRFAHTPGKIKNDETGDVACDHYHRRQADVQLMRDMGLQAYRFSIAWPRILPAGRGRVNQAGLDFYSRLVDGLLEAGITPFVTLYHWDLPQALQDRGGWANRDTAQYFADYAGLVCRRLGDRVLRWITHNEPWVVAFMGHQLGRHAPGLTDTRSALRAAHHLLLSHGLAAPVIRQHSPAAEVGIALNINHVDPAGDSEADLAAARRLDGYTNRWFLDPLAGRPYPADMVEYYREQGQLPQEMDFMGDDLPIIATPIDFVGLNYYTRLVARAGGEPTVPEGAPVTEMGWEVYPDGLYHVLNRLHTEYHLPKIYITENGAAYSDGPDETGRIADTRRRDYLRLHFAAAQRAIQAGAPLAGYFVWSLMDNFEWAHGFSQRFGLVWLDYRTQERIIKDSGHWYSAVIAQNGFSETQPHNISGAD